MVMCSKDESNLENGDYQWEGEFLGSGQSLGDTKVDNVLVGDNILLVGCMEDVGKGG